MGIYLCVRDLNSHSQPPNHRKGSVSRFSLVEQSQIVALWQVFVHVTQETPQKLSLDLGFGSIFVSVFSTNVTWTHTKSQCKKLHSKDLNHI